MPFTVTNCGGWTSGGLEQVDSTVGSPSIGTASPAPKQGTYRLELAGAGTAAVCTILAKATTGAVGAISDHIIVEFYVQFNDITPTGDVDFFEILDTGSNTSLALRIEGTSGDLILVDAANAEIASEAAPFTVDTWHRIKIFVEMDASGDAEVFFDGSSVISVSAQDFLDTFPGGAFIKFSGGRTGGEDMWIDNWYVGEDAATSGEGATSSDFETFQFKSAIASATDNGDALDTGNWDDAGETPLNETNVAVYNNGNQGSTDSDTGGASGPSGSSDIDGDGNMLGGVFYWRVKASVNESLNVDLDYGNSVDGVTSIALTHNTAYTDKTHVTPNGDAAMPLSTEFHRQGFGATGSTSNVTVAEQWYVVLHDPGVAAAAVFIPQTIGIL